MATPATSMSTTVRQSDEIRRIIDDFSATLSKATSEIKVLTREKGEVERAYEDLMEVNENLIKDLVRKKASSFSRANFKPFVFLLKCIELVSKVRLAQPLGYMSIKCH